MARIALTSMSAIGADLCSQELQLIRVANHPVLLVRDRESNESTDLHDPQGISDSTTHPDTRRLLHEVLGLMHAEVARELLALDDVRSRTQHSRCRYQKQQVLDHGSYQNDPNESLLLFGHGDDP